MTTFAWCKHSIRMDKLLGLINTYSQHDNIYVFAILVLSKKDITYTESNMFADLRHAEITGPSMCDNKMVLRSLSPSELPWSNHINDATLHDFCVNIHVQVSCMYYPHR